MRDEIHRALILGRDFYRSHDYARAGPLLAQVIEEHPTFADVHNMLGVISHEHDPGILASLIHLRG